MYFNVLKDIITVLSAILIICPEHLNVNLTSKTRGNILKGEVRDHSCH